MYLYGVHKTALRSKNIFNIYFCTFSIMYIGFVVNSRTYCMWPDLRKLASICTTARHTHFTIKTIAVHINWQFRHVSMLKVALAAFAVACSWDLSDIHEYLGCLQMALYLLDKQTADSNSLHDWLMSLAMDLAVLCDIWRWKWHQWMPFGWF